MPKRNRGYIPQHSHKKSHREEQGRLQKLEYFEAKKNYISQEELTSTLKLGRGIKLQASDLVLLYAISILAASPLTSALLISTLSSSEVNDKATSHKEELKGNEVAFKQELKGGGVVAEELKLVENTPDPFNSPEPLNQKLSKSSESAFLSFFQPSAPPLKSEKKLDENQILLDSLKMTLAEVSKIENEYNLLFSELDCETRKITEANNEKIVRQAKERSQIDIDDIFNDQKHELKGEFKSKEKLHKYLQEQFNAFEKRCLLLQKKVQTSVHKKGITDPSELSAVQSRFDRLIMMDYVETINIIRKEIWVESNEIKIDHNTRKIYEVRNEKPTPYIGLMAGASFMFVTICVTAFAACSMPRSPEGKDDAHQKLPGQSSKEVQGKSRNRKGKKGRKAPIKPTKRVESKISQEEKSFEQLMQEKKQAEKERKLNALTALENQLKIINKEFGILQESLDGEEKEVRALVNEKIKNTKATDNNIKRKIANLKLTLENDPASEKIFSAKIEEIRILIEVCVTALNDESLKRAELALKDYQELLQKRAGFIKSRLKELDIAISKSKMEKETQAPKDKSAEKGEEKEIKSEEVFKIKIEEIKILIEASIAALNDENLMKAEFELKDYQALLQKHAHLIRKRFEELNIVKSKQERIGQNTLTRDDTPQLSFNEDKAFSSQENETLVEATEEVFQEEAEKEIENENSSEGEEGCGEKEDPSGIVKEITVDDERHKLKVYQLLMQYGVAYNKRNEGQSDLVKAKPSSQPKPQTVEITLETRIIDLFLLTSKHLDKFICTGDKQSISLEENIGLRTFLYFIEKLCEYCNKHMSDKMPTQSIASLRNTICHGVDFLIDGESIYKFVVLFREEFKLAYENQEESENASLKACTQALLITIENSSDIKSKINSFYARKRDKSIFLSDYVVPKIDLVKDIKLLVKLYEERIIPLIGENGDLGDALKQLFEKQPEIYYTCEFILTCMKENLEKSKDIKVDKHYLINLRNCVDHQLGELKIKSMQFFFEDTLPKLLLSLNRQSLQTVDPSYLQQSKKTLSL